MLNSNDGNGQVDVRLTIITLWELPSWLAVVNRGYDYWVTSNMKRLLWKLIELLDIIGNIAICTQLSVKFSPVQH